jgi:hypothetical protein
MNRETLILIFAIPIILLYIVYVYLKAEKRKIEEQEEGKFDKLLTVLKEYSKEQPRLSEILNKFGLL